MKLTSVMAAALIAGAALPAGAQQLYPAFPVPSLPPSVCTTTQQPPVTPKVVTIDRNGASRTMLGNTGGVTTTTTECSYR